MSVREDYYAEIIRNYWLVRGYAIKTYIADGTNLRSNLVNGMPRPQDKLNLESILPQKKGRRAPVRDAL